jgi:hypothetical protein
MNAVMVSSINHKMVSPSFQPYLMNRRDDDLGMLGWHFMAAVYNHLPAMGREPSQFVTGGPKDLPPPVRPLGGISGGISSCLVAVSTISGRSPRFANVSRILKRGAPFLFTSGDEDCLDAKEGTMNGVTFRYFSYSPHSYRRILREDSFTLVDIHADSGKNTYYLAKKS